MQLCVKSGDGGNGAADFDRSAHNPRGKPNGGNGGKGGNVIFVADANLNSLASLKAFYRASNGRNGFHNRMTGSKGEDLVIKVPAGSTLIPCKSAENFSLPFVPLKLDEDKKTKIMPIELDIHDQMHIAAVGGAGGRGNLALGVNNDDYESGKPGEKKFFIIELKKLADYGLVGMPNAGKSSFLRAISNAKPKVASYPFTTINPFVGVVNDASTFETFSVADIPGLIKGANKNVGLGHAFLKHIEKSKYLALLLDVSIPEPWQDLEDLIEELHLYKPALLDKKRFIIANKIDREKTTPVHTNIDALRQKYPDVRLFPISAKTGAGVADVLSFMQSLLKEH